MTIEKRNLINLPFFATRVINTPLMIEPDKLHIILQVIGHRIGLISDLPIDADMVAPEITLKKRDDKKTSPETIAVIPIYGSLVYRSSGLDAMSGLTSYGEIRASFTKALKDPNVKGIVFDLDSPGGEVTGVFDLVDTIYNARGTKPIYAMVNEIAYSAAYAIASAANKIYLPRTGTLGSIGVIAIHTDQSGYDEKVGVKYIAIYAGKHKNDFSPHTELSKEARASLQEKIDEIYALFIETVARNRDIDQSAVRGTEANIYRGMHAVDIGLADAILTWEEMLGKLKSEAKKSKPVQLKTTLRIERKNEMTKKDQTIENIKSALIKEYEANPQLKEEFKTVDDFIKARVNKAHYEMEFAKSPDLQSEFGTVERYIAFKNAESKGNVKIIGNKVIN